MDAANSAISEVTMTASLTRRVFLFGSFGQFASYFLWMAFVFLGCMYFMGPETPRALFITTLLGAFVASLPALIVTLPARFSIRASGIAVEAWLRDLDPWLFAMGYRRADGAAIRYEHGLPRYLRWSESGFDITRADGRIVVTGPFVALRRLRRNLLENAA